MREKYTYGLALVACLLLASCAADAPDLATHEESEGNAAPSAQVSGSRATWLSGGQNSSNTRHQPAETRISPQTVAMTLNASG